MARIIDSPSKRATLRPRSNDKSSSGSQKITKNNVAIVPPSPPNSQTESSVSKFRFFIFQQLLYVLHTTNTYVESTSIH